MNGAAGNSHHSPGNTGAVAVANGAQGTGTANGAHATADVMGNVVKGRRPGRGGSADTLAADQQVAAAGKGRSGAVAKAKQGAAIAASAVSGAASTVSGILSRRTGGSPQRRGKGAGGGTVSVDMTTGAPLIDSANGMVASHHQYKGGSSSLARPGGARARPPAASPAKTADTFSRGAIAVNHGTPSRHQQQQAEAYRALIASRGESMQAAFDRPAWNSTPMRHAPAALKGLKPVTPEPWAADEAVYDRVYNSQKRNAGSGFGVEERHLDKTARGREKEYKYADYMARFDNKYAELGGTLNKYDGNPFT